MTTPNIKTKLYEIYVFCDRAQLKARFFLNISNIIWWYHNQNIIKWEWQIIPNSQFYARLLYFLNGWNDDLLAVRWTERRLGRFARMCIRPAYARMRAQAIMVGDHGRWQLAVTQRRRQHNRMVKGFVIKNTVSVDYRKKHRTSQ